MAYDKYVNNTDQMEGAMPVISRDFAVEFAHRWIEAWNQHDLDAVLSHYTDDFTFSSLFITTIAAEPSGVLHGKAAVRAYWRKGLDRIADLHFELRDVLAGVDCLTLYYLGHRGMAAESFVFDKSGKVKESHACYTIQP
jgi:hypothetical protein